MRKDQGFEVQDRIRIEWGSEDADVQKAFEVFAEYIREETLATDVVNGAVDQASELQVNGNVVKLMVTKNQ